MDYKIIIFYSILSLPIIWIVFKLWLYTNFLVWAYTVTTNIFKKIYGLSLRRDQTIDDEQMEILPDQTITNYEEQSYETVEETAETGTASSMRPFRRRLVRIETIEETIFSPIEPTTSVPRTRNKTYIRVSRFSKNIWNSIPDQIELYGDKFNFRYSKILKNGSKAYYHCNIQRSCPKVGYFNIPNSGNHIDFFISDNPHDHYVFNQ